MTHITSKQNVKIKEIRGLKQRKNRVASQLFIVEGIRHVGEAFEAQAKIESICYAPDLLKGEYANSLIQKILDTKTIEVLSTTPQVFESLSQKENPVGILAVVRQNHYVMSEFNPAQIPWGVALISPQDPGNLGTILRTADAVGVSGIFVIGHSVDITHPTVIRASMGAIFSMPIIKTTYDDFSDWSSRHNYQIYGASAKAAKIYNQIDYKKPSILFLGSEREGLSETHRGICEEIVKLPMEGSATSLNLSVAAGVLLYEMYNQFT
ncbi:MAG: RNA methyltransferase [Chloroflexota bacterium]